MKTYRVWYRKEPPYRFDEELRVADITAKYSPVIKMFAGGLDEVLANQQQNAWSFKYDKEMKDHVRHFGPRHLSMSVGDVAEVEGNYYQLDGSDWRNVN